MTAALHLSSRRVLLALVALLIMAFGLRVWDLGEASVWHDEAWSIRSIRDPIGDPDDNTPPLYYTLLHVLWRGAGESPFVLRYGSVLLDLITIALAAALVRRWAGWEAALLAASLLGVSPLLWAYAREIRAYVLVPLLALVLLGLAEALLRPRARFPWRVWIALLAAEVALLWTHNLSVPVIAWLNLVVGGVWLWERRWRWLAIWLGGQLAALAAYLPWLLGQSPSGTPLNTTPDLSPALVWRIWQGYFAPVPEQLGAERALEIGSALFGLAALASVAAAVLWKWNRQTRLVLSQAVLLPLLATVELIAAQIDFHPRYYVAGVPAALMLIALGATSVPAGLELRRLAIPAVLALAWGASAASLTDLFGEKYSHDDFEALAAYYATLPAEAVIVIPYGWEPALEVYYAERQGIEAEIVGVTLHSDADTAIETINAALDRRSGPVWVELLTWFQLPADVRGMYPCLLEASGRPAREPVIVKGIATQPYWVERPLELVSVSGVSADYGPVDLTGAGVSSGRAVCARTAWEQAQPGEGDWRVAGRLLTTDPPGWTIARSDSDIRRDDQAPTSAWEPGDQGEAFSLLRFPPGAPPGEFTVQVGVYSEMEPNGLDRLIEGIPAGRALALARVEPVGTNDRVDCRAPCQSVSEPVAPQIALVGHDAQGGTLNPGQEVRITLYWHLERDCCQDDPWTGATLALRGENWEVEQAVEAYAGHSLDWHALAVPVEAGGEAVLTLETDAGEPITLAGYTIEQTDRLFAPPAFEVPMQAEFGGLAVLEGFSVVQTTVSPDETLGLTLVWRATHTPPTSYRVFTHLLDESGRVIAQHDGYPVGEARPTTGWVSGEYLVDPHALAFEIHDYRGPARLEIGFYQPETGERVRLSNGADHLILPVEIMVQ